MKLRPEVYPREDYWNAIQMMANRMAFSEPKYGPLEDNYPHRKNSLLSAEERIQKYKETGNTEWLIDAANQLVIEALFPSHILAHFRATDSDESPGIPKREEKTSNRNVEAAIRNGMRPGMALHVWGDPK